MKIATVVEDVGDGGGDGGGAGRGTLMKSPPQLIGGKFIKANEIVTVRVEAGIDNAAAIATVMFDWERVRLG